MREADGKWVSVRLMQEPLKALTQSYTRTKAKNYKAFRETMELHTNSSNNTIFADADGNIAYFHSNFIPKRDPKFDWTKPVDGSDPATEWNGVLSIDETPGLLNPAERLALQHQQLAVVGGRPEQPEEGGLSRLRRAAAARTRAASTPSSVLDDEEGLHARLADRRRRTTATCRSSTILIPPLLKAYDQTAGVQSAEGEAGRADRAAARTGTTAGRSTSVPTSLAVFWGEELWQRGRPPTRARPACPSYEYMETKAPPQQRLEALAAASDKLAADFGSWKTPWGDINRFQRLTGDIVQPFDDAGRAFRWASRSARWGSLASFGARTYNGTKKMYGTSGNSFVAVVEFGDSVRARAVTAGGESGDPKSPHFNDQAARYATGDLREVYFYRRSSRGTSSGNTTRENEVELRRPRLGLIALAAWLLCSPGTSHAQAVEVTPFVGYRFGGDFFERITGQSVDLDDTRTVGAVVNVKFNDDGLFAEALFTHQEAPGDVPRRTVRSADGLADHSRSLAGRRTAGVRDQPACASVPDRPAGAHALCGRGRQRGPVHSERRWWSEVDASTTGRRSARRTSVRDVRGCRGRAIACSPGFCLVALDATVVWQAEFSAGLVVVFP